MFKPISFAFSWIFGLMRMVINFLRIFPLTLYIQFFKKTAYELFRAIEMI